MRLIDLDPEWVKKSDQEPNTAVDRYLDFRCPRCPDEPMPGYTTLRCRMILPVGRRDDGPGCWGWNGEEDFEKLTLTPSIWHHCRSDPHFYIQAGQINFA